MTIKTFYLVGQDKNQYHQEIHLDPYHDFEALQFAVAEQYNIIQAAGIGLQDLKGIDLPDLDAVLDCDEQIGVTVDGQPIRDPTGPEGLPLVGSYYEVFPDHLVSEFPIVGPRKNFAGLPNKYSSMSTLKAMWLRAE
ncbi:MAG: hypothetical protein Q9160_005002 [Pyrenula sp. 1 TL-2023]